MALPSTAQSIRSPIVQTLRDRPVFILGVSRSGTTLMRKILNSSEELAICDENNFLGDVIESEGVRQKLRRFGDLRLDENARRAVEALYNGVLAGRFRGDPKSHWKWITRKVPREEFLRRLLASDRSERSLFRIMMEVYADHRQKPGIGEKTPAHVRYVPTILEWFPECRIVHMVRDPRAVFVSDLRRRWAEPVTPPYRELKHSRALFKLYVLLYTTAVWFDSVRRLSHYSRQYSSNYQVVRFEDLVSQPEKEIRQVCRFIGVGFTPRMVRQKVVSRGFAMGQSGFDRHAADRWRQQIDSWSNAWLSTCLSRQMKRLGYTR
ncbi:MAG: sulfotransferase [Acidobacteriota bacterium]